MDLHVLADILLMHSFARHVVLLLEFLFQKHAGRMGEVEKYLKFFGEEGGVKSNEFACKAENS